MYAELIMIVVVLVVVAVVISFVAGAMFEFPDLGLSGISKGINDFFSGFGLPEFNLSWLFPSRDDRYIEEERKEIIADLERSVKKGWVEPETYMPTDEGMQELKRRLGEEYYPVDVEMSRLYR